ncbi:hypothetical protein I8J29_33070 [Paenibacillus sp. MWE-103]|uniref:Uncharacterized protein n=1 Tax=Paenibacillus artemisiicola TaxID=1172618 RepID=A0ABS3WLJ9_9BACL|nr:hypothetical protein [Paenibacillus artemisiicola]MBO7749005.1 hypothetical protein [Paenibacillus artemisiicola]
MVKRLTILLSAAWLVSLLSGCEHQDQHALPLSSSPRKIVEHSEMQDRAKVGQSSSCDEPPDTLIMADTTYTFVELDTAEEPVMNLGYIVCEQGRFMTGDGGPGTLVINGTAPSESKRKAVIFTGTWGRALYEDANGQTATIGASASANDGIARLTAVDVHLAYMTWPIPTGMVSRPLFGSIDRARIATLLHKLEAAERIDGNGLTSPLSGRSMALNIEIKDGRKLQIRPAWTCKTGSDDRGSTTTSCLPADNRIWVSGPDDETYFATSDWLYLFVGKGFLGWMPEVKPYEAPNGLHAGASFSVIGHGSRAEYANVALMKGDKTILSMQSTVTNGEWHIEGTVPGNLMAGDYEWRIDTGTTTYGAAVHITN